MLTEPIQTKVDADMFNHNRPVGRIDADMFGPNPWEQKQFICGGSCIEADIYIYNFFFFPSSYVLSLQNSKTLNSQK